MRAADTRVGRRAPNHFFNPIVSDSKWVLTVKKVQAMCVHEDYDFVENAIILTMRTLRPAQLRAAEAVDIVVLVRVNGSSQIIKSRYSQPQTQSATEANETANAKQRN